MTRTRAVASVLAVVAVAVPACTPSYYKVRPEDAAQAIVDIIGEQNDYELNVADVRCPEDIEATVGLEFDCHFTGRGGDYVAHMKIQKAEGDKVLFAITAGPVNG